MTDSSAKQRASLYNSSLTIPVYLRPFAKLPSCWVANDTLALYVAIV